ncbi:MAG TPA: hypothetical protein VK913_12045, partial [Erythrobacter sp.]|nr:hypothetical protein [Erythrobacter sp.]
MNWQPFRFPDAILARKTASQSVCGLRYNRVAGVRKLRYTARHDHIRTRFARPLRPARRRAAAACLHHAASL